MGSHEEVQEILTTGLHTAVRRARIAWDANGAGLQVTVDEIKALVRKLEYGISYRGGPNEPERFLSAPKAGDCQQRRSERSVYSEGPSNRRGRPENERQGSHGSYQANRSGGSYTSHRERDTFTAVESGSPHSSLRSSNARTASNP